MRFYFVKKILFSKNAGSIVRGISYLCITGIAISVFATILVVSIMLGLNDSIHKRTLSIQPYFELPLSDIENKEAFYQQVRSSVKQEYPSEVYLAESQDLLIRTVDGLTSGILAIGYEAREWEWVWQRIKQNNFGSEDFTLNKSEIAIGIDLARELALYEGDEVVVFSPESLLLAGIEAPDYQRLKITRVLRTENPDYDANVIFYDSFYGLKQIRSNSSKEEKIHIRLHNKEDYPMVKSFLVKKKWDFVTWEEKNASLLYALKMEKYAMSLFLVFTVLIASLSIFTVLSLVISQKRKDIGVLQSFGMTKKMVRQVFTGIGMSLSTLGVFIGGTLAILTCVALKEFQFLELPAEIYYDHKVPVRINWVFIWSILFSSLIIAYLGSLIPSLMSLKDEIVDLLRGSSS